VTVLVNGARGQGVSPLDRGIHFGDGLFETIACRGGRPRFLTFHLERLISGCERLQIRAPEPELIAGEVCELARDADRAIVKVLVTRGAAVGRGYAAAGKETATRITIRYPWPDEDVSKSHDGVKVCTLSMRLGENPLLAGLKHCNRLEQILARAQWPADIDVSEGLLFSSSGNLVSGTLSNVFIVRGSIVQTPRIDLCGVAGVMRRVVIREMHQAGIRMQECVLRTEDLQEADEMFLTNARIGIWPVRELNSRAILPGPITRRLQEILAPLLEGPRDAA